MRVLFALLFVAGAVTAEDQGGDLEITEDQFIDSCVQKGETQENCALSWTVANAALNGEEIDLVGMMDGQKSAFMENCLKEQGATEATCDAGWDFTMGALSGDKTSAEMEQEMDDFMDGAIEAQKEQFIETCMQSPNATQGYCDQGWLDVKAQLSVGGPTAPGSGGWAHGHTQSDAVACDAIPAVCDKCKSYGMCVMKAAMMRSQRRRLESDPNASSTMGEAYAQDMEDCKAEAGADCDLEAAEQNDCMMYTQCMDPKDMVDCDAVPDVCAACGPMAECMMKEVGDDLENAEQGTQEKAMETCQPTIGECDMMAAGQAGCQMYLLCAKKEGASDTKEGASDTKKVAVSDDQKVLIEEALGEIPDYLFDAEGNITKEGIHQLKAEDPEKFAELKASLEAEGQTDLVDTLEKMETEESDYIPVTSSAAILSAGVVLVAFLL